LSEARALQTPLSALGPTPACGTTDRLRSPSERLCVNIPCCLPSRSVARGARAKLKLTSQAPNLSPAGTPWEGKRPGRDVRRRPHLHAGMWQLRSAGWLGDVQHREPQIHRRAHGHVGVGGERNARSSDGDYPAFATEVLTGTASDGSTGATDVVAGPDVQRVHWQTRLVRSHHGVDGGWAKGSAPAGGATDRLRSPSEDRRLTAASEHLHRASRTVQIARPARCGLRWWRVRVVRVERLPFQGPYSLVRRCRRRWDRR
jgi:hypothetical protein